VIQVKISCRATKVKRMLWFLYGICFHISNSVSINIKCNARFEVLTAALLRFRFSGMQKWVAAWVDTDILRDLHTLKMKAVQSFIPMRTTHPMIQCQIAANLNIRHIKQLP